MKQNNCIYPWKMTQENWNLLNKNRKIDRNYKQTNLYP